MANHTPLPWTTYKPSVVLQRGCQIDGGGQVQIAFVFAQDTEACDGTVGYCGSEDADADGEMIITCVNACGAVNPTNPAAAAEALAGLIAACERVALVLRAASINPRILPGVRFDNMANDLRAAIALATGKGA